ncbi:secreted and transmembrane protein 1b-like [Cricetulus griseus]|uniref:Secreted and transmembrane protein 1b-like n=1 Tax=Cricetulus griseus TaxID=10029 RepID=A0A9J7H582_CRIGR|nr:secreted and transmembrane protein 1b-like [Cricetulus griseus]XP_035304072.1 secreted and transmembrane protein 1b-like [Cricetulus griseus]
MVAYSVTSTGPCPRILWTLLLLAASLNAHTQTWDNPTCTESEVSAPRGNRVVMACNISNTFRDVTIGLTANGKTSTIFNTKPPGNYFNDSWQLQIQGGQAYLVITDVQDIHAGQYVWRLNGNQRPPDQFIVLNVTDPDTEDQEPESLQVIAEPPPAVHTDVTIVMIIIIIIIVVVVIIGIIAFAWYKHYGSRKHHRYEVPGPGLSPGSPHSPYLALP